MSGLALYIIAALLCGWANSFHALLTWRFVHGLAAASVTVSRSVVRDLYSGRDMARVMSLTFVVFLMVPMLAPSMGQLILLVGPGAAFSLPAAFLPPSFGCGSCCASKRRCTPNIAWC